MPPQRSSLHLQKWLEHGYPRTWVQNLRHTHRQSGQRKVQRQSFLTCPLRIYSNRNLDSQQKQCLLQTIKSQQERESKSLWGSLQHLPRGSGHLRNLGGRHHHLRHARRQGWQESEKERCKCMSIFVAPCVQTNCWIFMCEFRSGSYKCFIICLVLHCRLLMALLVADRLLRQGRKRK